MQREEIEYKNIFIDRTKLEANANKYTFVWKKSIDKLNFKLYEKNRLLLKELNNELNLNYVLSNAENIIKVKVLNEVLSILNKIKNNKNMEFPMVKEKAKFKNL